MTRESLDSRESFTDAEQLAYEEQQAHLAEYPPLDDDMDDDVSDDDLAEMCEYWAEADYLADLALEEQERMDYCETDEAYGFYGYEEDY